MPVSVIIADLALGAFVGVHLHSCIVLHGYFSLGKTSGPTTKTAGSEALPEVVPFKVRSRRISQEVQVGFENIYCSGKYEHESMSVSSRYK